MPVAAVRPFGSVSISSGSLTATSASAFAPSKISLVLVFVSVIIKQFVISLAVPAVVFTAIMGALRCGKRSTPTYCSSGAGFVARIQTALPQSCEEPPPRLITPPQPISQYCKNASLTLSSVGLGVTPLYTHSPMPCACKRRSMRLTVSVSARKSSVTSRNFLTPRRAACVPISFRQPGRNREILGRKK